MATASFGRPIVVSEENVSNLVYAAEHPVDFAEMYKNAKRIRTATKEDIQKIREKHCTKS